MTTQLDFKSVARGHLVTTYAANDNRPMLLEVTQEKKGWLFRARELDLSRSVLFEGTPEKNSKVARKQAEDWVNGVYTTIQKPMTRHRAFLNGDYSEVILLKHLTERDSPWDPAYRVTYLVRLLDVAESHRKIWGWEKGKEVEVYGPNLRPTE